jgi:hypothetical protein
VFLLISRLGFKDSWEMNLVLFPTKSAQQAGIYSYRRI